MSDDREKIYPPNPYPYSFIENYLHPPASPPSLGGGIMRPAQQEEPEVRKYEAVLKDAVAWGNATFPHSTPQSKLAHFLREYAEWRAHPTSSEEMADCLILLAHLRASLKAMEDDIKLAASLFNYRLADAIEDKMAINRTRTWGQPDAEGVVEHIRTLEPFATPEWADPTPPPLPTTEPQP